MDRLLASGLGDNSKNVFPPEGVTRSSLQPGLSQKGITSIELALHRIQDPKDIRVLGKCLVMFFFKFSWFHYCRPVYMRQAENWHFMLHSLGDPFLLQSWIYYNSFWKACVFASVLVHKGKERDFSFLTGEGVARCIYHFMSVNRQSKHVIQCLPTGLGVLW